MPTLINQDEFEDTRILSYFNNHETSSSKHEHPNNIVSASQVIFYIWFDFKKI